MYIVVVMLDHRRAIFYIRRNPMFLKNDDQGYGVLQISSVYTRAIYRESRECESRSTHADEVMGISGSRGRYL
jgi:hypothetical protein